MAELGVLCDSKHLAALQIMLLLLSCHHHLCMGPMELLEYGKHCIVTLQATFAMDELLYHASIE